MPQTIEIVMMSMAALILIVGKSGVDKVSSGNIFGAGMNAMISIFGIAWMGDTFFNGNIEFFKSHIADIVSHYPFLFSVALFIMSIMLFSQAATVRTLFPLAIGLGIQPLALVAMFPAVNGYFFVCPTTPRRWQLSTSTPLERRVSASMCSTTRSSSLASSPPLSVLVSVT